MDYFKAGTDAERAQLVRKWTRALSEDFDVDAPAAFPDTFAALAQLYRLDGHLVRFRDERESMLDDDDDDSGVKSLADSIAEVAARLAAAPPESYEDLLVHAGQVAVPENSPEQLDAIEQVLVRTRASVERRIFSSFRIATADRKVLVELVRPRHDVIVKKMSKMAPMFPKALRSAEDAAALGLADEWKELRNLAVEWAGIHDLVEEWRIEGIMQSRGTRARRTDAEGFRLELYAAAEFRYADPLAHTEATPSWMVGPLRIAHSFAAGDAGIFGYKEIDAARSRFVRATPTQGEQTEQWVARQREIRILTEALKPSKLAAEADHRRAREERELAAAAHRRAKTAESDAAQRRASSENRSLRVGV